MSANRTEPEFSPQPVLDHVALIDCVEECFECAVLSVACAETDLGYEQLRVVSLLSRLRFDGVSTCLAAGRFTVRDMAPTSAQFLLVCGAIRLGAALCDICVEGHQRHVGRGEDCAVCRAALRRCRLVAQQIATMVEMSATT